MDLLRVRDVTKYLTVIERNQSRILSLCPQKLIAVLQQ